MRVHSQTCPDYVRAATVLTMVALGLGGKCTDPNGPGNTNGGTIQVHCQCHCQACQQPSGVLDCGDGLTRCLSHYDDGSGFTYVRMVNYCFSGAYDASALFSFCDTICHAQVGHDLGSVGGCESGDGSVDGVDDHNYDLVVGNACNTSEGRFGPSCTRVQSFMGSMGPIAGSQSTMSFGGDTGGLPATGNITFATAGAFSIVAFELSSASVNIGGGSINNVEVFTTGFGGGQLSGTSFVIPKANISADVVADYNGPQSFTVIADNDATGTYDPIAKTWSLDASMSGAGANLSLHLEGTLTSVAPISDPGPPQTVASDSTGFGRVTLDASLTTNPGGGSLTIEWTDVTTSPPTLLGTGTIVTVALPVGVHTIAERSVNGSGAESVSEVQIKVERTCASVGANCGDLDDGIGNTLFCGTCPSVQTCGGSGQPNVCGCIANANDLTTDSPGVTLPQNGPLASLGIQVNNGWAGYQTVSFALAGLPDGISASTGAAVPPDGTPNRSAMSVIEFSVPLNAPIEQRTVTLAAIDCSSGSCLCRDTTFEASVVPCVPNPSPCAGACGIVDDGCGNHPNCGGCDQFAICLNNQCVAQLQCPPGWVQCDATTCAPTGDQCVVSPVPSAPLP